MIYTVGAMFAGVAGVLQFCAAVGRRSDRGRRAGARRDRRRDHRRREPLGGRGTVFGTLLGATTMTVIQIGCTQKGYPNWVQQIVTGAIIVLAVALDRWRQGRHTP